MDGERCAPGWRRRATQQNERCVQPRSLVDVNAPLEEQEHPVQTIYIRARVEQALVVLRAVLVEEHRALPAPPPSGDTLRLCADDHLERKLPRAGRVVHVDGHNRGLVMIVPELVLVDVEQRWRAVAVHRHVSWVTCQSQVSVHACRVVCLMVMLTPCRCDRHVERDVVRSALG